MDKAILTRADMEREAVAALYPDALHDPTITGGLVMIAHGTPPAGAWRSVAVSLALENDSLRKLVLRYSALIPSPALNEILPSEAK